MSISSIASSLTLDRYVHPFFIIYKHYFSKATKSNPNCAQTTPQIARKPTKLRLYVNLKLANATNNNDPNYFKI